MAKKKATKKELMFPATVFGMIDEEWEEGTVVYYSEENLSKWLEADKETLVGIYELVGFETRTKKVSVEVSEYEGK